MFPNLKLKIFHRGSHQNRLAKTVGIDETVLSKIIHGYRQPTAAQRKLLADFLEADEAWLFERPVGLAQTHVLGWRTEFGGLAQAAR